MLHFAFYFSVKFCLNCIWLDMIVLMIVNVDGLKLGGQLDRETSLVAFSYIVYFVHCAFSMLSENKFCLLTVSVNNYCLRHLNVSSCPTIVQAVICVRQSVNCRLSFV